MQPLSLANFAAFQRPTLLGQAPVTQNFGLPGSVIANPRLSLGQPAFAQSFPIQQNDGMLGIMMQLMQIMQSMMQLVLGQQQQPPFPGPLPGPYPQPGPFPQPGGQVFPGQFRQLDFNDFTNYVLAGSQGGRANTSEQIFGRFADPNSRFAQAGANEFDAAIAKMYAAQFKAHAMGLDVVFNAGQDNVQQIAANMMRGQQAVFTPEAEMLAQVAAVYRGELGGASGAYNNPVLRNLLVQWGRGDLAQQPGVGQTDVESVGAVIRALNEQPDPRVRQAWLQQIFDFQGNTPNSPSGAVPNLGLYQNAIHIVRSGQFDQLLNNYQNGIRTQGPLPGLPVPIGPGGGPGTVATPDINRNIDFTRLNGQQRSQLGLSERDRAILHLWGRQVISKGFNDGGIYNNVLSGNWQDQDEVALIRELAAKEQAEFGGITGKALDREFFALMQRLNPNERIDASRWLNSPVRFSDGRPIEIVSDINTLQQRTGLSGFEQAVLRLWGHEPLFNGGTIDGSILAYTIGNANALDSQAKAPNGQNTNIDGFARALLEADLASDGVRNGDSLKGAFGAVLDKIYLGGPGVTQQQVTQRAQQVAQANGRSLQQIGFDVQQGMTQALADAARFVQNHPVVSAVGIGSVAMATAVCPFLGGMAVGAAGIAAGQNFLQNRQV